MGINRIEHVTLTFIFDLLTENFNFAWLDLLNGVLGLWYFTWVFLGTIKIFPWVPTDMTLILVFYILIKIVGYIFWMVCTRTEIFPIIVPCDKTFPWFIIIFWWCYLRIVIWHYCNLSIWSTFQSMHGCRWNFGDVTSVMEQLVIWNRGLSIWPTFQLHDCRWNLHLAEL
jgi:hypothetical protein